MNHNSLLVKRSQQSVSVKLTHANVLPYSAVINMNFNTICMIVSVHLNNIL